MSTDRSGTYDVIIAAFNSEAYIREAIESVLQSSCRPSRIIVIDDASTDRTVEIASAFDNVEVLRNEKNQERSITRNRGIQASSADYIQFLDADDLLHPEKTAIQVNFLDENPHVDVAVGDVWLFQDGHWPGEKREYSEEMDFLHQLISKNIFALHSLLFRKTFFTRFGKFDPDLPISEDRELYIRSIVNGAKWAYTPGSEVYYRQHQSGTIRSRQYESAYYNAAPIRKHRRELAEFAGGKYRQHTADSLRTLARNANMVCRPMSEVRNLIGESREISEKARLDQNRLYQLMENLMGAVLFERLLRIRFWFNRS